MLASKDKAGQGNRGCLAMAWLLTSIISYTRGVSALATFSTAATPAISNVQPCSPYHEHIEHKGRTVGLSRKATKDHRPCGRQEAPAAFQAKRRAVATFQRLVGGTGRGVKHPRTAGHRSPTYAVDCRTGKYMACTPLSRVSVCADAAVTNTGEYPARTEWATYSGRVNGLIKRAAPGSTRLGRQAAARSRICTHTAALRLLPPEYSTRPPRLRVMRQYRPTPAHSLLTGTALPANSATAPRSAGGARHGGALACAAASGDGEALGVPAVRLPARPGRCCAALAPRHARGVV